MIHIEEKYIIYIKKRTYICSKINIKIRYIQSKLYLQVYIKLIKY